jgi:predicted RNA-binding Zn ribbon-like protein
MDATHSVDEAGRVLPDPSWPSGREAPAGLEVVRRFLNTVNRENGADRLASAAGARDWLATDGHRVPVRLAAVELRRVRDLRDTLFAVAAEPGSAQAVERLNRIASAHQMTIRFDGVPRLDPIEPGVDHVVGAMLGRVYEAMRSGAWPRLKACHHCDWVYFDQSKNASGTWCSSTACGARQKAAAYRRRQKERTHA